MTPWRYCNENCIEPDLILVDGRFRSACFLTSCIKTTLPIRILFDDYVKREHYHFVENIVTPSEVIADRMAVFDIAPDMVRAEVLLDFITAFYDPQ